VDVRVIATTNRALLQYIEEGNFREDLFYRLNVIPLHIPPLRARLADISLLVDYFVEKHNKRNNKNINEISNEVHESLCQLHWNGNVRELENVIERAVVLAPDNELLVEHLLLEEQPQNAFHHQETDGGTNGIDSMVGLTVQEMERRLIMSTLGKVSENRTRAAEMLGISIRTLRNKLKEYEAKTLAI
jgi:two-component system response regulator FlrC